MEEDDDIEVEPRLMGDVIDALGVKWMAEEGVLPMDAIVLVRSTTPDGHTRMSMCVSEALDWVVQRGMLEAAVNWDG